MIVGVPLYKQSRGFSCGPASFMMVMKWLDDSLVLSERSEMEVWEDANLSESRGAGAFGLALAALKRGLKAKVFAENEGIGFEDRLKEHDPFIDMDLLRLHYEEKKEQARRLGVEEVKAPVTWDAISGELEKGVPPIVLVSSGMMGENIQIPHWVVVTAMDNDHVVLHNPETGRVEKYGKRRFLRYLGFHGETRMVSVYAR